MLRANLKWKLITRIVGSCLALVLAIGMTGCERSVATTPNLAENTITTSVLAATDGSLSEVNTPASIDRLAPSLAKFQPRVSIISPQTNQILDDDRVTVKFQVNNFPIFKSKELGLGNHLHVILDKQTYQGVYDLTQPLVFENLAPGTHTLRVFASRPWHESFKNPGAYAQTTFHVLTKTTENNPDPQKPLLTYSRPAGKYGAEPIMLDYYLTNAPAHPAPTEVAETIPDWKIRITINNQQFSVDRWAPIYLQGFKPGKNLVKLELLDDRGNPIPNVYNESIGVFDYDPQSEDSLSKLVQGKISTDLARSLVDPNYAIASTSVPAVGEVVPIPTAITPVPHPSPSPIVTPLPVTPSPVTIATPQPTPLPNVVPALPQQPVTIPIPVTPPPQYQQPTNSPSAPVKLPNPIVPPQPSSVPNPVTIAPPQPSSVPSPVTIAPPQPLTQPAPSAIAPQPPQPSAIPSPVVILPPQPLSLPIPVTIVPQQPYSLPSAPVFSTPSAPTPVPASTPVPTVLVPVPDSSNQPHDLTSQQVPSPKPIAPPTSPTIQPQVQIDRPTSTAPVAAPQQNEWQAKAIELIKFLGVKIRAFTNTIPARAQRFGNNVQIWAGETIDRAGELIRSWQEKQAG